MTLPIESKYNYTAVDISPDGYLLIAINEGITCKNKFIII